MPPRTIGPWEILSVIGRGGVGTVYRARHARTGEPAAVKLLGPAPAVDPAAARRLAREFEALRQLSHPNIVRVYDAGACQGYSYLAMELVEGLDLRSYLSPALDEDPPSASRLGDAPSGLRPPARFGLEAWSLEPTTDGFAGAGEHPWRGGGAADIRAFADMAGEPETDPGAAAPSPGSGDEADSPRPETGGEPEPMTPRLLEALNRPARLGRLVCALRQVCDALGYMHARGLVHRDLKPGNIMVDDARRARLMDFGLVKSLADAQSATHRGGVVGTYRYMAPEQAMGLPVDGRADLYSLGVILYELLCGRPPPRAQKAGERWRDAPREEPVQLRSVNPGADERLSQIAERLLRGDPAERFQSALDALRALGG